MEPPDRPCVTASLDNRYETTSNKGVEIYLKQINEADL